MTSAPARIVTGPWTLYRLAAGDGTLLYIGISRRPGARLADHERTASWWPEVRSLSFETFPTWDKAWGAEGLAIAAENSLHNIARRARRRPRPAATY